MPAPRLKRADAVEKDFWRSSEEKRFKNKPTSRILIHVHLISDSIIAHFGRSQAHRPNFFDGIGQIRP
jgi:hypothetical protein